MKRAHGGACWRSSTESGRPRVKWAWRFASRPIEARAKRRGCRYPESMGGMAALNSGDETQAIAVIARLARRWRHLFTRQMTVAARTKLRARGLAQAQYVRRRRQQ